MAHPGYDRLTRLLEGEVRAKRNNTRDIEVRSKARRITHQTPEVMVKVSGHTKGAKHVKAHLDYISRNGELELENERGEKLKGRDDVRALHKDWMQDPGRRRPNTRDTNHIVLSMPPGTDEKAVKNAARAFAQSTFAKNHPYVFVLHRDDDHPHVHLAVKTLGFDGKRLHVKKGDPQTWRETFADQLRRQGVEAEATPRATRGVVTKGVKQALWQMRQRGLKPAVDEAKVRQVIEEVRAEQAGRAAADRPWEAKIKDRQTQVRRDWLQAARELQTSDEAEDRTLAGEIGKFVQGMPPLQTERHKIRQRLASQMSKNKDTEVSNASSRPSHRPSSRLTTSPRPSPVDSDRDLDDPER